jgi:Spy/CpxP family protein refolding chaperone
MPRTKHKLIGVLTGLMVLCFFQSAYADLGSTAKAKESLSIQSAIKTDSAGSYVHGEKKAEGSKAKAYARPHKKPEGSSNKSYWGGKSHHKGKEGHGYSKSGHRKSSHAYKGGYGKSHGHKKSSHGGHGKSPFKHVMDYKHKLGLTYAQIETMKSLDVDFKKKIIQAKADHEIAHIELDLQVHSGKVDEVKIRAAGAKIVASKTNKIMAMIDAKIQLLNLLTVDQRHKMANMMH